MQDSTNLPTSSFTTTKINATTYAIQEDDLWNERPIIYAKLHTKYPVIILNDTGCDEPSPQHKNDQFTRLRTYLELYPVPSSSSSPSSSSLLRPLNPNGERQYIIICTHCHFDHLNGITQFMPPSLLGPADVIASAAGRDFVETDLEEHGLFKEVGRVVPWFKVSRWAGSFERLSYPLTRPGDAEEEDEEGKEVDGVQGREGKRKDDLGVTILHTPGHTPDSLAWYDHEERFLYVGDSFYRDEAIVWPKEGNMIDWAMSMKKLLLYVRMENARRDEEVEGGVKVERRVKICCGHETFGVDGEEILGELEDFFWGVIRKDIPVVLSEETRGEIMDLYLKEEGGRMRFFAPRRLVDQARRYFHPEGKDESSQSAFLSC